MSINLKIDENKDHSVLYFEFRRTISWGWNILGVLSIISALTSQESIKSWQVNYSLILASIILLANILDKLFESAVFYAPILIYMFFAPFFLTDETQKPWISIGFITVATIFSVSNIENIKISLCFSISAIFLQEFIAYQNLPSITDSKDLLLLNGYFGVSWCLLLVFALLYIRQGYFRYHQDIEQQLNQVYEKQLISSKSTLAINTSDYRNLQLHGTVLNTLIYSRDNLNFSLDKSKKELAKLIQQDIVQIREPDNPISSLESQIRQTIQSIGNREISVWLEPITEIVIEKGVYQQILEIVREVILNLKKHSTVQNCEISINIEKVKSSGFAFMRPTQYKLIITINDDGQETLDSETDALSSRSLNRIIEPIMARQSLTKSQEGTRHTIEIPLINFQPNGVEKLFDMRLRSQEFVAKSYVFIGMLYGAICLPAFLRINIEPEVLILALLIVIGSFISVFLPRFNIIITSLNALLCLFPMLLAVSSTSLCKDLNYLPWLFNGLIGPIFFAALIIPNKAIRWIPVVLFFIESIIVTNLLPQPCKTLLSGSTPGLIVLSILAIIVLRIRKRSSSSDLELISQYKNESSAQAEIRFRLDIERKEILESLEDFAVNLLSSQDTLEQLKEKINLYILKIRALLIAAEYFDHLLVQSIYYLTKSRLNSGFYTELNIFTNKFAKIVPSRLAKVLQESSRLQSNSSKIKISILFTDKSEIRISEIGIENGSSNILYEDDSSRLVDN